MEKREREKYMYIQDISDIKIAHTHTYILKYIICVNIWYLYNHEKFFWLKTSQKMYKQCGNYDKNWNLCAIFIILKKRI